MLLLLAGVLSTVWVNERRRRRGYRSIWVWCSSKQYSRYSQGQNSWPETIIITTSPSSSSFFYLFLLLPPLNRNDDLHILMLIASILIHLHISLNYDSFCLLSEFNIQLIHGTVHMSEASGECISYMRALHRTLTAKHFMDIFTALIASVMETLKKKMY